MTIELYMTPTSEFESGVRIFNLELLNNGKAVDRIKVNSGAPNHQELVYPTEDYSGSMRAIPEGIYAIGRTEEASVTWGTGIGKIWISLDVLPAYRANNRSAFGIHLDENRSFAVGSAGCVVARNQRDLVRICQWNNSVARPSRLVVDYKLGFLKSKGYENTRAFKQIYEAQATPKKAHQKIKNFLDLIAFAEGTDGVNGYRTMFGYKLFDSFIDHPRELQTAGGYTSDAAGRYQFLSTTWDAAKLALKLRDFSPGSQDRACMWLLRNRGAYNDIMLNKIQSAIEKASWEWASLPPGRYGQPSRTMEEMMAKYKEIAAKASPR